MLFTVVITSLAAFNALYVPLHLERQISFHPHTLPIQTAGAQGVAARGFHPEGQPRMLRAVTLASGSPALVAGRP